MAHLPTAFVRLIFENDAMDSLAQYDVTDQCAFRFSLDCDKVPFEWADYHPAICSVVANRDMHNHRQAKNATAANCFGPRRDFHMVVGAISQVQLDCGAKERRNLLK